ncbi:plasminogen activator inhibitor 1 RNA-binding protein [Sarotherodon galilaeus]
MLTFLWKFTVFYVFYTSGFLSNYVTFEDEANIPAIAKYFNTKGRYEEVNPYLREDILAVNRSILQPPLDECQQIHLTAIIRHGTRYPTTKNIKEMQQLYNTDMDGRLVQKGVDELKHLAVRLSKLFPSLISEEKLRGGFIKFITSSKHRCVNSTLSFKAGLTELWDIKDVEFDHAVNDALMRFFDKCTRFVEEVDNNPSAVTEVEKFKQGPEMRRVQQKIADILNVPYSSITYDVAEAAFYLCAYEFAIRSVKSPWCELFDKDDAKVIEYASDLREFWKRGYGHDINSKASCILFHDVFSRMDKTATQNKLGQQVTEAVTVQVGHADTLLPLLTLLGFFNDSEPLTSTNYAAQAHPNLLLVLSDCGGGDLRLQPLLNEKPVTFPGLTDRSSMPLHRDVLEHYRDLLQGCDFETECQQFKQPAKV